MSYSVGKWEGDALVVESNGCTSRSWLDGIGHPRSEATRITERIRRRNFGHMEIDVTIDDPVSYTKPFGSIHTPASWCLGHCPRGCGPVRRPGTAEPRTLRSRAKSR